MSKKQKNQPSLRNKPSSRSVAVGVVHQVRFGHDAVQAALDTAYSRSGLPAEERAFCTELVYGTLRKYYRLEFFLRAFLDRFDSLPKEMGIGLCVASYELFYTRVPAYATVDTFVTLIRSQFGPVMGKVANGVLRNLERHRENFFDEGWYREHCLSPSAALACWHSVPEWLLEVWFNAYGQENSILYLEASSLPAPHTLRFNAKETGAKEAFAELLPFSQENATNPSIMAEPSHLQSAQGDTSAVSAPLRVSEGYGVDADAHVNGRDNGGMASIGGDGTPCGGDKSYISFVDALWSSFSASPHLTFSSSLPAAAYGFMREGLVSQQSGAVLEVLQAMRPQEWRGPVWDCCCGRGGKTLALLEQGVEVAFASDISKPRLRGLQQELVRLGMDGRCFVEKFSATQDIRDSQFYAETGRAEFGTILIDAPCSGFGTLARHPEIRFRRTLEDVSKLAQLQYTILDNASRFLKGSGDLIYITCTLMPQENEEQTARFLDEHSEITLVSSYQTPAWSRYGEFFYGVRFKKA